MFFIWVLFVLGGWALLGAAGVLLWVLDARRLGKQGWKVRFTLWEVLDMIGRGPITLIGVIVVRSSLFASCRAYDAFIEKMIEDLEGDASEDKKEE